uniref:Ribosome-inactivating protein n=1 Tax=Tanacetum cinerariifolium TaxID=118510 RepID=A0A699QNF1_TANCI|nr:ribosome-inactivating protein [Tanacetum cinerariifolium]
MPVPVADEQCPDGEPTINIVRRDGQCVNVKDSQYYNGNFIILGACGNAQRNQLWTFKSNGTIRSNGKCLTSGYGGCWGNQRWADDTILNPNARLVMDVRSSDVSLQDIILYQPTGNPNKKWLAF